MHSLAVALVVLGAAVLQTTFFSRLGFGLKPDLLLITVVSYSLIGGIRAGTVAGVLIGLVEDLLAGGFIGLNAMTKSLTGFLIGMIEKNMFHDSIIVPSLTVFLGTLLNSFAYTVVLHSFDQRFALMPPVLTKLLPLAFFNALLTPLVYYFIRRIEDHYTRLRMGSFK